MKTRIPLIFLLSALTSCQTLKTASTFAACVKEYNLNDTSLMVTVKNTSLKNIRAVEFHIEFNTFDEDLEAFPFFFKACADLEPEGLETVEIPVSDIINQLRLQSENFSDTSALYIQQIFVCLVEFEDGTVCTDYYGNFSI